MSISISSNFSTLQIQKNITDKSKALEKNFEKLSSGREINRASDDPAGLAVALSLLANAELATVAGRNISDGVSAANIADGAISTASDITGRMAELATQSANGTLTDDQRQALDQEYQSLRSELDRISASTEFNGQALLNGSGSITLQAGTSGSSDSQLAVTLPSVSSDGLGLAASIATQEAARTAVDQATAATDSLAQSRSEIGSSVSRLETAYENIVASGINQQEAASRIMDLDFAKEASSLAANKIQQQVSVAVQTQANLSPASVLRLLS